MLYNIIMILGGVALFAVALLLASKNGSKAAQLEAIKAELKKIAKEQEKAHEISENVANLSADDARKRLHDVANKQSNGM